VRCLGRPPPPRRVPPLRLAAPADVVEPRPRQELPVVDEIDDGIGQGHSLDGGLVPLPWGRPCSIYRQ
jgi:hypothetical protein